MSEYPKALYKGNSKHYDFITVDDLEEENKQREQGFTDFAKLEEYSSRGEVVGNPLSDFGVISQDEYDSVVQERDAAFAKIAELEATIEKGMAENEQLRQQIASYQPKSSIDYSAWTSEQLREEITKQGKTFKSRDSKAELIVILEA